MLWLLRHAQAREGNPDAARRLTDRRVVEARAAPRRLGERV
jgi:phosphohistidine phosphatase SixA